MVQVMQLPTILEAWEMDEMSSELTRPPAAAENRSAGGAAKSENEDEGGAPC